MTALQYAKWLPKVNKYEREIQLFGGKKGKVDVYRVLSSFDVKDPELQHLIKKALCAGLRGHKDKEQDLKDIIESAQKMLERLGEKDGN